MRGTRDDCVLVCVAQILTLFGPTRFSARTESEFDQEAGVYQLPT